MTEPEDFTLWQAPSGRVAQTWAELDPHGEAGQSLGSTPKRLECKLCGHARWMYARGGYRCTNCGSRIAR